jgi:hypothetical protein
LLREARGLLDGLPAPVKALNSTELWVKQVRSATG